MYVKLKHVSSRNLLEYRAKLLNFNFTSWGNKVMFILEIKKKCIVKLCNYLFSLQQNSRLIAVIFPLTALLEI